MAAAIAYGPRMCIGVKSKGRRGAPSTSAVHGLTWGIEREKPRSIMQFKEAPLSFTRTHTLPCPSTAMPRQLNLALLVCDTPRKEVVEKYGDYPHLFPQVFNGAIGDRDVQISWKHFDVVHKQEYPDLQDLADNKTFDGIVITGSVASAYLDDPWILKLVDFVKVMRTEPYRSQVRLVGVCFGHQIIARACGGTCVKNPKGWEVSVGHHSIQRAVH